MKILAILLALCLHSSVLAQSRLDFECEGGEEFWASFPKGGGHATLHHEGRVIELHRSISASGEKVSLEGVTLWLKGDEATLELADGTRLGPCAEKAALPIGERELLRMPVRSSTELEVAWFNEHLLDAATRGETWTLDSSEIALRFIDSPAAPYESVTSVDLPIEDPSGSKVTVIKGWLADDSVSAVWHRIELEREGIGRWRLVSARRANLCQRGRQQHFFAAESCP